MLAFNRRSGKPLLRATWEKLVLKHAAVMLFLSPVMLGAQTIVAGDWLLTEDVYGTPFHQRLTLKLDGTALTGTVGRRALEGAATGNAIQFTIKNADTSDDYKGTI